MREPARHEPPVAGTPQANGGAAGRGQPPTPEDKPVCGRRLQDYVWLPKPTARLGGRHIHSLVEKGQQGIVQSLRFLMLDFFLEIHISWLSRFK